MYKFKFSHQALAKTKWPLPIDGPANTRAILNLAILALRWKFRELRSIDGQAQLTQFMEILQHGHVSLGNVQLGISMVNVCNARPSLAY